MKAESIKDLKKIKIKDNKEPLVDVKKFVPDVIIALEKRRLKKEKTVYLRKTAAKMLKKASKLLPKDCKFKIKDGWRPLKEQEYYYRRLYNKFKKRNPKWSESQLRKTVNKWTFPPDAGIAPYHTTGGAIDLTICYPSEREWAMRTKKKPVSKRILKNRRFLKDIMEKVGFTNYALEWWHFSYGDSGWAHRTGRKTTLYGPTKPKP